MGGVLVGVLFSFVIWRSEPAFSFPAQFMEMEMVEQGEIPRRGARLRARRQFRFTGMILVGTSLPHPESPPWWERRVSLVVGRTACGPTLRCELLSSRRRAVFAPATAMIKTDRDPRPL